MITTFDDAIIAIHDLKDRGLISDYAIGGAVAQVFWDEAIPTFDLDVLVLLPNPQGLGLAILGPIYEWAAERGYKAEKEHIRISEIPVQFMPAYSPLAEEAVKEAKTLSLNGLPVRVVAPEYLAALWLEPTARSNRRKERIAKLREAGKIDEELFARLRTRYNLSE